MRFQTLIVAATLTVVFPALAHAAEQRELVIKNHRFTTTVTVPAGRRVKLLVADRDDTPEEFESHDPRREKLIPANSQGTVWVGPLPAGEYGFFGDFHPDTAKGKLIAK